MIDRHVNPVVCSVSMLYEYQFLATFNYELSKQNCFAVGKSFWLVAYELNLKAELVSLHDSWSHNIARMCNIINIDYGSSSIWC